MTRVEVIWLVWWAVAGACVGSFLNVVIYRLPEGKSIVTPGSHCFKCGHMLHWWENVPILAWFYLGGKCSQCKTPFSFQYAAIELLTCVLFAGLYVVYFFSGWRREWAMAGFEDTWPAFLAHLILLGGLIAATLIDAKLFIIPLSIPWFVTISALVLLPLNAHLVTQDLSKVLHPVNAIGVHVAIGGFVGLALALALLWTKVLPRSFSDLDSDAPPLPTDAANDPRLSREAKQQMAEAFLAHPHPRREVLKETLFVALPLLGALIGMLVKVDATVPLGAYNPVVRTLAGAFCGYLVGGGMIWITRILGTLGFGKEAMGLGDVHLLGAIGAVLGPLDAVLVFFIAPFLGLTYVAIAIGVSRIVKGQVKIIPYGPYLAAATLVVMIGRQWLPF
jgi:leader peptidase (prepilin peptidase)/N-methyltransferase